MNDNDNEFLLYFHYIIIIIISIRSIWIYVEIVRDVETDSRVL